MYFNKFSSGTILALLALSGMLFLVPLAAPAHAVNGSPVVLKVGENPLWGNNWNYPDLTITNPASNQYAITAITITIPNSNWCIYDDEHGTLLNEYTDVGSCTSVIYYADGTTGIPPGVSDTVELELYAPDGSVSQPFPFTGTLTTTVQDESSAAYYSGPSFSFGVIAGSSVLTISLTAGSGNTVSTYHAGTAPYTVSEQLTCNTSEAGCNTGYQNGVTVTFGQSGYSGSTVYSFGSTSVVTSGSGSSAGTATTTFQPSNIAGDSAYVFGNIGLANGTDSYETVTNHDQPLASGLITTVAGAPSQVGFTINGGSFPNTIYSNIQATSTHTTGTYPSGYTGAIVCQVANDTCTGGDVAAQKIGVTVADKFGNPIAFGVGGVTFTGSQGVMLQTASGAVFDDPGLPASIGPFTPNSAFFVPDNYFQGNNYGTAGVITATITGTYATKSFSVSGSTGSIVTSTYAGTAAIDKTDHVTALPVSTVTAGKSIAFDVVLDVAQSGVPVTVYICDHTTCGTTKGYSGTLSSVSGVTNSTGVFSDKLTVDTTAPHVAYVNASISAPITGTPKNSFWSSASNSITTQAGAASKFTVVVSPNANMIPHPITSSIGGTLYVNVVTSDAYGNPVTNVGLQQVQINLVANPTTITVTSAYIPTGCYETNGTSGSGCTVGDNSFGAIAWTLPTTAGTTGTISASGVLNGVLVTSPTVTINVVSKLPTVSVFAPTPVGGIIYSNSVNVQFRGWANVSKGYNNLIDMSTLGWKVGSGTWQSTGLAAGTNDQWSVVATLPVGLSTIAFNATDANGNVGIPSSTFQVLVDNTAPTITNVTPAGTTLNPGQLFSATIVDSEGDLNASSVQVWANGTALASSAVTVTGTNNPGNSVTYTVTAALPTGHWSVQVTASDLAGNSAAGATENVSVTVAFGDSITFNTAGATYGLVGAYKGVTVSVTNSWSTAQTIVVFATLKGTGGSIYVAQGTVTLSPGQTASVFCADLSTVPAGTYSVTFSAVTTSNAAVSAPTTPITVTAT